jgi:protein SFI1
VNVASSALRVWHKRLATQQGAHAFAVQYARVQLQFRILFRWRVQLRAHLKHFRQAKIAGKYFMMRRAWRIWVDKAEARAREKRLREWNTSRVGKLFSSTSEALALFGTPLELTIFGPAGWKEKALRLRRHRLAEQEIRGRIDAVGISLGTCLGLLVLIIPSQNILNDALSHWTNRVIAVKLRELEVVQQKNRAIVL